MINISYNKEDNIILVERSGDIHIRDLMDYFKRIDEEYGEHKKLYIFDDTNGSVSKFDHRDEYILLINDMKKRVDHFQGVYVAIVADTPSNTALSDIYKMMTSKIRPIIV